MPAPVRIRTGLPLLAVTYAVYELDGVDGVMFVTDRNFDII